MYCVHLLPVSSVNKGNTCYKKAIPTNPQTNFVLHRKMEEKI